MAGISIKRPTRGLTVGRAVVYSKNQNVENMPRGEAINLKDLYFDTECKVTVKC